MKPMQLLIVLTLCVGTTFAGNVSCYRVSGGVPVGWWCAVVFRRQKQAIAPLSCEYI